VTRAPSIPSQEELSSRMLSLAFEYSQNATKSEDPFEEYHKAALLFDELAM
jgi:hypothetical protein